MTHQRLFTVAASFELLILMLFAAGCSVSLLRLRRVRRKFWSQP